MYVSKPYPELINFKNCDTVYKFQDFLVIKILRKINFGECNRNSKTAIFAIFWGLNFVNLVNFSLQKLQKDIKSQNSEPQNVLKWQFLQF